MLGKKTRKHEFLSWADTAKTLAARRPSLLTPVSFYDDLPAKLHAGTSGESLIVTSNLNTDTDICAELLWVYPGRYVSPAA